MTLRPTDSPSVLASGLGFGPTEFLTQPEVVGGSGLVLAVGIVEEHALVHQGPVLVGAATG